jgi:hypothetical protein
LNITLAIIDIDGVIANPDARLAHALSVYMSSVPDELPQLRTKKSAETSDVYWQTAFRTDLVALDAPVEGAREALAGLSQGGQIIPLLLTSRPEAMRESTQNWLLEHGFGGYAHLVMKPPAATNGRSSIVTAIWKASIIDTLAMLYEASRVWVVDDSSAILDEVMKHLDVKRFDIKPFASLDELVSAISL